MHDKNFLYEPRGFSSVDEHNEAIIKNWNDIVSWNDTVIHLGDVYMTSNHENACRLINRLNGNIMLIRGNHDSDNKIQAISENCPRVEIVGYSMPFKYKGMNFYLSHYPAIVGNYDADKPLKVRVFNLCGHSHSQNRWSDWDKGAIYHCELDAHDNCVVSLDDIIEEIRGKVNEY